MARSKAALSLFGILVLAALFLGCIREVPADSPFQHTVRHLRTGMTVAEVRALAQLPRPGVKCSVSDDYGSQWVIYTDYDRRESLSLMFVDDALWTRRLAEWEVWRR